MCHAWRTGGGTDIQNQDFPISTEASCGVMRYLQADPWSLARSLVGFDLSPSAKTETPARLRERFAVKRHRVSNPVPS
ncbi:hypothetical protein ATY81_02510 [Rhizobium sp. R72]|nr:hypothetical protein ATY81_02510 [Rhizobium sp. R72]OWW05920.1 hypothetical protein ATY80_02510 [Rhizobium sp. R711]